MEQKRNYKAEVLVPALVFRKTLCFRQEVGTFTPKDVCAKRSVIYFARVKVGLMFELKCYVSVIETPTSV